MGTKTPLREENNRPISPIFDLILLTPTGDRPAAFKLCHRYVARQKGAGRLAWVVVDDGQKPLQFDYPSNIAWVVHDRRRPFWQPGQNTQRENLARGLDICDELDPTAPIAIIEDDDHYAPGWAKACVAALRRGDLVGEKLAKYYNVKTRQWATCGNNRHASLRSTAFKGAAKATFRRCLERPEKFYDLQLWRNAESRYLWTGNQTLGIKGLPGRQGITESHNGVIRGHDDRSGARLREFIGDDAKPYLRYYDPNERLIGMYNKTLIANASFSYGSRQVMPGDKFEVQTKKDFDLLCLTRRASPADAAKPRPKPKPKPQAAVKTKPAKAKLTVKKTPAKAVVEDPAPAFIDPAKSTDD